METHNKKDLSFKLIQGITYTWLIACITFAILGIISNHTFVLPAVICFGLYKCAEVAYQEVKVQDKR